MTRKAGTNIDMLSGGIVRNMIVFALPLIASGVLQQSFNSVDIAVVGRFAGHEALAAVGSNGPVISLIVNLFVGISVGANVIIANYIGSKNRDGIRRAVATSAALALLSGLALLAVGLSVARPLLTALGTPAEVLPQSVAYLRIFAVGMPFMMVYNFGSAILRSFGDTRRPFYALVAGGAVNVVLDLLLVIKCGMGVAGVATATVVAMGVSAVVVVIILLRFDSDGRLRVREIALRHGELGKILRVGLPAGIQGMVFSLSNVFIQSAINSYGTDAMAGSAAALTYEVYCYFIIVAFVQSVVAFTGQNYGAGNLARCRKVMLVGMALAVLSSGVVNMVVSLFASDAVGLFVDNAEAAAFGMTRIHVVLTLQFIACSYEIAGASLRGQGYSLTPTLITVFGTCVLRLVWVYCHSSDESFANLLAIYPITWVITGTAMLMARVVVSRRIERRMSR